MRRTIVRLYILAWLMRDAPGFFAKLHSFDWYSGALKAWVDCLELKPGARILEIGCGPGDLARDLAQAGYHVVGIDRSPGMIARARKYAQDTPNLEFRCGNGLELGVDDASFDAVIAASLLNIVSDRQALIAEMSRVVRPSGIVSVLLPSSKLNSANTALAEQKLGLGTFQATALGFWAANAKKIDTQEVASLFEQVSLEALEPTFVLEGMLAVVSGRRKQD